MYYNNRFLWIVCSHTYYDGVLILTANSERHDTINDEYPYLSLSKFEQTLMEIKLTVQSKNQTMQIDLDVDQAILRYE